MQMVIAALLLAAGASEPALTKALAPMPAVETQHIAKPRNASEISEGVQHTHAEGVGPMLRYPVPLPSRAAHTSPHLRGMWCRFYFRPAYNYGHQFDFPWRRPPYRHPPNVPHR